jgi:RNA polymerase sigma-70 factor (ECF subfamily)
MTDDVRAAQAGDGEARDRVLRAFWPRAYRLAYAVLNQRAAAEDAAQEALIRVDARLNELRDADAFAVWSARIAVNAARDAFRRRRVHDSLHEAEAAERFEEAAALRLDVSRALASLPVWLREPVVLCYLEGFTSAQAGEALGAPAATVRFRLLLARRRLTALLVERSRVSEEYAG